MLDNENNNENNQIIRGNPSFFIHDESESFSFISNEENKESLDESIINDKKEIDINNLKMGKKILCPEKNCFSNTIISIEPNFLTVNSNCGKHIKTNDIFNYVDLAGIKKDGKEQCNYCKKDYKKLKNENSQLYQINSQKNICENCKKSHINEIKENNLIDFEIKDYICNCSKEGKKYIDYCFKCCKNLCILCSNKHKDHDKNKLNLIGKEKKKDLKKKLKEQKDNLKAFNDIMNDWIKRAIENINKFKKKLELYIEINETIIKQYNSSKTFYKAIKNIEYINFEFDSFVMNIIKSKDDYQKQNDLVCKFLNEKSVNYMNINIKEENFNSIKEKKEKAYRFNWPVKNICELKKEELLIVDINNIDNNNEELFIYKKPFDFNQVYMSKNEDREILSLSELKNGQLLIVQINQFQIIEISNEEKSIKTVQIQNINEQGYSFKEIIQLKIGILVSLSIHPDNANIINFWKKNLMTGKYEIIKRKESNKNVISMVEIDKYYFLALNKNNQLILYNSRTFNEIILDNFTINNIEFIKMVKIGKGKYLFAYNNLIILYNLYTYNVNIIKTEKIIDLCKVNNSDIYCLASFYERNNNFHGIYLIKCDSIGNSFNILKFPDVLHTNIINCIYQLSNGDIISGSSDTNVKIFRLEEN